MKKIRKFQEKVLLHPIMAFLLMSGVVVLLSGILDLFDASITYNKINVKTGNYESTLVTVESLLNLSGIKYIFSNTVSSFVSFTPLSMLLIVLIGIGIMDKSGFLDTLFFVLTKNVSKTTVTFVLMLVCVLASLTGDLCFVVIIPLAALLFKYGKRNPTVGIISSFAALSLGYGMNFMLSSVGSSLASYTEMSANTISSGYVISSFSFFIIMIAAIFIGTSLLTYVTEKIIAPKMGKYEVEEEIVDPKEKLTKREKRGLFLALFGGAIYFMIFIYNIVPYAPLGGNFLDYSQTRYIDKLFGYDSFFNSGFVFVVTILFFLLGLLYGLGTKNINNHRDICDFLSHSLDGIGKIIVLLFCASMFISLLKYTNIGSLVTAGLAKILTYTNFGGVPLILLVFFISMISVLLLPSFVNRWAILSGTVVPMMMTAGFTPEFAQLIFTSASSIMYPLTPAMAYFVIYVSFMEKYEKDGTGLLKSTKYLLPYSFAILAMWIVLILIWYFVGIPLGINSKVIL